MTAVMRVQKLLSRAGVASRREAEALMLQGRVRVNGAVCTELGTRVDPAVDQVELDGRAVAPEAFRDIAFHKPEGVVTTRSDPQGRPTVYDHLPPELESLKYIGRLDMDTGGLLLFSNRGDLIHRLTHPSFEVEREYEARVRGVPDRRTLDRLVRGVVLDDGPARARRAEVGGREGGDAVVTLVLTEGRNREVRRLMEAVGHPVVRLQRTRFGPVRLGALQAGHWRDLDPHEGRALQTAAPPVDDTTNRRPPPGGERPVEEDRWS